MKKRKNKRREEGNKAREKEAGVRRKDKEKENNE